MRVTHFSWKELNEEVSWSINIWFTKICSKSEYKRKLTWNELHFHVISCRKSWHCIYKCICLKMDTSLFFCLYIYNLVVKYRHIHILNTLSPANIDLQITYYIMYMCLLKCNINRKKYTVFTRITSYR